MDKTFDNNRVNIRGSLTVSGLLLFLAGFLIFMGIISAEIFYPAGYNSRDNYISELGAAVLPDHIVYQPSAAIFNSTMMVTGIMILISGFFVHKAYKKFLVTVPLALFGFGLLGVGVFPGHIAPWHGVFALITLLSGGVTPVTSYKIVSTPLRYFFIWFGIVALVFLFAFKYFIPMMGAGGAERWVLYPEVFWIMGFGTWLLGVKEELKQVN